MLIEFEAHSNSSATKGAERDKKYLSQRAPSIELCDCLSDTRRAHNMSLVELSNNRLILIEPGFLNSQDAV